MYMPIITALKQGLIKPEEFVAYEPDEKRSIDLPDYLPNLAISKRKFYLGWHAIIYKNFAVLLIADNVTEEFIAISETRKMSTKELKSIVKPYKNKSLQTAEAIPTEELVKEIPSNLICNDIIVFYSKKRRTYERGFKKVQPMLFLPPDTVVEIDNDEQTGKFPKTGFKLYPRNSFNISMESNPIWVPLVEAMHANILSEKNFIEYIPDKGKVRFETEETNANKIQIAETEYDMGGWHPFILEKNGEYLPYLVATHCSKFELEIFPKTDIYPEGIEVLKYIGQNQFDHGIKLLERYAQIYNNKELNCKAVPLNEEMFDTLNKKKACNEESYYLANTFTYKMPLRSPKKCYVKIMGLEWVSDRRRAYGSPYHKLPIRIAIQLPKDIMIQINESQYDGSTEEKAIKIKLAGKKEL